VLRSGTALTNAARLYNPRFDGLSAPAGLAQITSAQEMATCVAFAASSGLALSIRNGGHSYGGWSTGLGLVVDTRGLSSVQVDATAGVARIGAGAQLVDVYSALSAAGVALAGGSCPSVGISGLTLGGGVGVLTRAYGLTCDAVQAIQVVTADGKLRVVDATHDPDLFWALRGGGASFAAVTGWRMAVRPAPSISTFYLAFDFSHAAQVLGAWQSWVANTPSSLWSTCKLLADPGNNTVQATVSGTWIGAAGALTAVLAPLLSQLPTPTSSSTNANQSYGATMLQEAGCSNQSAEACLTQALQAPKRQPFAATSSIVSAPLPSAAIAAAVAATEQAMSVPGMVEGGVSFDALGGAVAAISATATPYPYRSALASVQYTATWGASAPAGGTAAAPFDRYVRGFRSAMTAWLGQSAYVNYADPSITDFGKAYWGANYSRLQQVKKEYDPGQLFTFAQAVKPA
jgi:FAD/FMN-containing dehydrogenase